jgi:LysR family transcriptional regulator for bpeEF and oprC
MKVFTRVVETASFSRAADALGQTPTSVSRAVQALEAHLGARLLNRTTRSISVTEDGEIYYERCVRVLGEIDDMESVLSKSKFSPNGTVKVSLPALMARSTVLPALPELRRARRCGRRCRTRREAHRLLFAGDVRGAVVRREIRRTEDAG